MLEINPQIQNSVGIENPPKCKCGSNMKVTTSKIFFFHEGVVIECHCGNCGLDWQSKYNMSLKESKKT